jgi:hypothetical protein
MTAGLGLSTARTIVGKVDGSDRTREKRSIVTFREIDYEKAAPLILSIMQQGALTFWSICSKIATKVM